MKNEKKGCAVAFLKAAVAYYVSLGITVERVMTDDGACYKSIAFRKACKRLRLRHVRTRPYTPKGPTGKVPSRQNSANRAYAQAYNTSKERAAELPRWLHRYEIGTGLMAASFEAAHWLRRIGLARDEASRMWLIENPTYPRWSPARQKADVP